MGWPYMVKVALNMSYELGRDCGRESEPIALDLAPFAFCERQPVIGSTACADAGAKSGQVDDNAGQRMTEAQKLQ